MKKSVQQMQQILEEIKTIKKEVTIQEPIKDVHHIEIVPKSKPIIIDSPD